MARLTEKKEYRKDGSVNIKGYSIALQKTECEKHNFNNSTEIEIEYCNDKIILKKKGI